MSPFWGGYLIGSVVTLIVMLFLICLFFGWLRRNVGKWFE